MEVVRYGFLWSGQHESSSIAVQRSAFISLVAAHRCSGVAGNLNPVEAEQVQQQLMLERFQREVMLHAVPVSAVNSRLYLCLHSLRLPLDVAL